MSRRLQLELELPDDVLAHLPEEELTAKAKESLVMELVREHAISQGKAAELLGLTRHAIFDLMAKYHVPVIDLTEEELRRELKQPLPSGQ